MNSEQDQIRSLAERIARRLSENATASGERAEGSMTTSELARLRAGLDDIQRRLAHIEAHLTHDDGRAASVHPHDPRTRDDSERATHPHQDGNASAAVPMRSPWLSGTYVPATAAHPSEERFGITEAVSELVDYFEREKTCTVEPGEKPCDHCGMCSSRGF